jgi:hypothetical protein
VNGVKKIAFLTFWYFPFNLAFIHPQSAELAARRSARITKVVASKALGQAQKKGVETLGIAWKVISIEMYSLETVLSAHTRNLIHAKDALYH